MKTVTISQSGKEDLILPASTLEEKAAIIRELDLRNIKYAFVEDAGILTGEKIFATLKLTIMAALNQGAFYLVFNRNHEDLDEFVRLKLEQLGWNLTAYKNFLSGTYVKYGTDAFGLWKEEEALQFYSDLEPLIDRIPVVEYKTSLPFPFNMFESGK